MTLALRFILSRSGSIAPVFSLAVAALLGFAAITFTLAVDLTTSVDLQANADAAALAGALAFMEQPVSKNKNARTQAAEAAIANYAKANLVAGQFDFDHEISIDPANPQSAQVTVTIKAHQSNTSAQQTGRAATHEIHRSATVGVTKGVFLCALSTDPYGTGVSVGGAATLNAPNCTFWSNSLAASAMTFSGSGSAIAEGFCAVGGAAVSSGYSVSPLPSTGCSVMSDPLAGWTPPAAPACTPKAPTKIKDASGLETAIVEPGVYCGGLTIMSDDVVLQSGIYHIVNGSFSVTAGANVSASGVTILLSGAGSQIQIAGGADVTISAPASGTTAGLALATDRRTGTGLQSRINGNATLSIEGLLYLPEQRLQLNGGGSLNLEAPYVQMVARNIELSGNGTVSIVRSASSSSVDGTLEADDDLRILN